ncbi:DUF397 domain-containing protein [Streptomyces sp. SAS_281]|uniref:DUF397 domain-containing protein n=1 Tax=Streptomyces sp. SAS_281 TaxID=3412744 RepID=UPI00403CB85F
MKFHDGISYPPDLHGLTDGQKRAGLMGLSNREGLPPMQQFTNGMPANLVKAAWIKSRKSEANGMCVQVAALPNGGYAMANSTDATGPALIFTAEEMDAFIEGVRQGDFNGLFTHNR